MTLHETKEATDTAAARAQADREELAKAAVEKQLLDQEVRACGLQRHHQS